MGSDSEPELDGLVAAQHREGATAWPHVSLPLARYREYVAERARTRVAAGEAHDRVIRTLPAADMYLAAACCAGDDAALAAFRDAFVPAIQQALAKLGMADALADEAVQRVLVMVFVGDGRPAQITEYGGRGTLKSWLRTIAVRTGRRMLGVEAAGATNDDEISDLPGAVADPELEMLRARYREQVRGAFAGAFAGLGERERNVLRQYHLDGLTIDQLAALYQVSRATTARWVAAARLEVVQKTRDQLIERFGIAAAEVDSIIRLVRSQLDVSVRELAVNNIH